MHKTVTRRSAMAIIGGAVSSMAVPVFAKQFETNGVAINGTDPVAYFTMSKPVQGSADLALNWNGVTWHFASGENRLCLNAILKNMRPNVEGTVPMSYPSDILPSLCQKHGRFMKIGCI